MFGVRRLKSGLRAAKPRLSPYVQNIYRIEIKYIFLEIVLRNFFRFFVFSLLHGPVENY